MNEREVDEQQVREEHLAAVDVRVQWTYLVGVLLGGTTLMLVLIALLGASGG